MVKFNTNFRPFKKITIRQDSIHDHPTQIQEEEEDGDPYISTQAIHKPPLARID